MMRLLVYILFTAVLGVATYAQSNRIDGVFNPELGIFETVDKSYWIGTFTGNYAKVSQNGHIGLIDKSGEIILPLIYNSITIVSDNRFIVSKEIHHEERLAVHNPHRNLDKFEVVTVGERKFIINRTVRVLYGVVDRHNNIILPIVYNELRFLFDELYAFSTSSQPFRWGVINEQGKTVVNQHFHFIVGNLAITETQLTSSLRGASSLRVSRIGHYFDKNGLIENKVVVFPCFSEIEVRKRINPVTGEIEWSLF